MAPRLCGGSPPSPPSPAPHLPGPGGVQRREPGTLPQLPPSSQPIPAVVPGWSLSHVKLVRMGVGYWPTHKPHDSSVLAVHAPTVHFLRQR